jgi:antibiotic biosynthesis monooxygenase (ABM) superfamily enzyme
MEEFDSAGVTGIVWRRVAPGKEAAAEEVMRQLMHLSRESEGYLGTEIFPPISGVQDAYVVLYRFDRGSHLRQWLGCRRRQELLQQIQATLIEPQHEFFFAHSRRQAGTASSVFAYRIRPEREADFQEWRRRILEEVRTYDGFLGTESFDTLDSSNPEFVVVVRFDNRANLDAWLAADIRKTFMKEVRSYVDHYSLRRISSGFEGWFDTSENKNPPASWRQAMVILTALFPVIMTLRQLLLPVFAVLPMPAAFLVLLTVDIAVLTYVVMPRFSRLMNFWLRPGPDFTWRNELAGWCILLGIIGLTLTLCLSAKF